MSQKKAIMQSILADHCCFISSIFAAVSIRFISARTPGGRIVTDVKFTSIRAPLFSLTGMLFFMGKPQLYLHTQKVTPMPPLARLLRSSKLMSILTYLRAGLLTHDCFLPLHLPVLLLVN